MNAYVQKRQRTRCESKRRNLNGLMCGKVPFTTAELFSDWLEASIFLYQMIKPTKF